MRCSAVSLRDCLAFLGNGGGLAQAAGKEKAAQDHRDGVEGERADQDDQGVIAGGAGENLSHDEDNSYQAEGPEEKAKQFINGFHREAPLIRPRLS